MRLTTPSGLRRVALIMALAAAAPPGAALGNAGGSGPPVDTAALLKDLATLASPEFGGRKTGTPGSRLAQDFIATRFAELGLRPFGANYRMPFSFTHTGARSSSFAFRTRYPSAVNLVGYIRGSKYPERYMVVSAHYDHVGILNGVVHPGADDNASGVAAMLAIADWFRRYPPHNTIVFAAFDGEELGLHGAHAFIKSLPFPRDGLALNLNLDMVGRSSKNEIKAVGVFDNPALKRLVDSVAKRTTVTIKPDHDDRPVYVLQEDWEGSSDHGVFRAAGVPFLYFGVDEHPDYHLPGDRADRIDPGFYGRVASLLIDMAVTADLNLHTIR